MNNRSVTETVLEKLADRGEHGLTHDEAAFHLGVFDLDEHVDRLRKRGYSITEEPAQSRRGKTMPRYRLER